MKRTWVALLAIVFLVSISTLEAKECLLNGKWKSNEKKTLKSMSKAKLTKKQRNYLSNNFFGKLVVVNTCKDSTSYFDGEAEVMKLISLKENGNIVTTEYYSELHQMVIKSKVVLEGECYSLPLEAMGFNEIFCRVK